MICATCRKPHVLVTVQDRLCPDCRATKTARLSQADSTTHAEPQTTKLIAETAGRMEPTTGLDERVLDKPSVTPESPSERAEPVTEGQIPVTHVPECVTQEAHEASGASGIMEDPKVLKKRAQWAKRQRAKRERDKRAQAQLEADGDDEQQTLAGYVAELGEIAEALRDKVLSPGDRAQYRLRGDILAKLILAKEKLAKAEKTKQPVLPPWFKR